MAVLVNTNGVLLGNGTSPVSSTTEGSIGNTLIVGAGNVPVFGQLDLADDTNAVTGTLKATNGGTGINLYASGDMLYASGTTQLSRRAIGTTKNVLVVSGGQPTWGTIDLSSSDAVGSSVLNTVNGGTGLSSVSSGSLLVGNGTGTLTVLGAGSQYKVLQSNGTTPSYEYLGDLRDTNGVLTVESVATQNAVNHVQIANAGSTGSPSISAVGTDTNVNLVLSGQGTGYVAGPTGYDMSAGPDEAFTTKGWVANQIQTIGASNHLQSRVFSVTSASLGDVGVTIPQGSVVTRIKVNVTTAFDAPISFGITGSTSRFAAESDIDETTTGISLVELIDAAMASDTNIVMASSGTPAAGGAVVEIEFKSVAA